MMRIYRYPLLNLMAIAMMTASSFAQDQSEFSLEEAETFAENNSLKIQNSAFDIEIARKKIWETTAIGLPQVSAEGQFQQLVHIPTQVVDASFFNPAAAPGEIAAFQMGQKYTTSATFNVSQLLFDGSYIVALKFSKFFQKMSETSLDLTKKEVRSMCREAYYNVLVAERNVVLMDSILMVTTAIWEQTKVFLDNGLIPEEEVDQLEFAVNRVQLSKQNGERQLQIAKNMLKLQMGYDLDKSIEVSQNLDDLITEIKGGSLEAGSVTNNANYVRLDQQAEANEYSLKNEKMAYLPSLGAFFTHSQNAFRNEFNFFADQPWYPTTIWGISLKVPITSSGMKWAKVKQAEIQLEKDANSLTDLANMLKFQEGQIKVSMTSALETMDLEATNVLLAKKIYQNAIKREDIGSVSALGVTQLQSQLLTAEANYIGAVMEVLQLKIQRDKLYNQ